jgi:hypothetical protein
MILLLKHYRGTPAPVNDVPMDQWTPEELSAHVQYMQDFAARLEGTGEFVDSQALSPEGHVRPLRRRGAAAGHRPDRDGLLTRLAGRTASRAVQEADIPCSSLLSSDHRLRMRTREDMAVAKAKGKVRGKQPKLSPKQQTELRRMHGTGEYSINDLAELFSIGRTTVYRALLRNGGR